MVHGTWYTVYGTGYIGCGTWWGVQGQTVCSQRWSRLCHESSPVQCSADLSDLPSQFHFKHSVTSLPAVTRSPIGHPVLHSRCQPGQYLPTPLLCNSGLWTDGIILCTGNSSSGLAVKRTLVDTDNNEGTSVSISSLYLVGRFHGTIDVSASIPLSCVLRTSDKQSAECRPCSRSCLIYFELL